MAQLKDLLVNGSTRLVGDATAGTLQLTTLKAPTSSGGSTYGPGTSGQILKTNGSTVYWANNESGAVVPTDFVSGHITLADAASHNHSVTLPVITLGTSSTSISVSGSFTPAGTVSITNTETAVTETSHSHGVGTLAGTVGTAVTLTSYSTTATGRI